MLIVRLDRYQAAITCPIATLDSSCKLFLEQQLLASYYESCGSERVESGVGGRERLKRDNSPRHFDSEGLESLGSRLITPS